MGEVLAGTTEQKGAPMKVTGYATMLRPWLPTAEDAQQRMNQLIRFMDDPNDPECDFQTFALVMALRSALGECGQVLRMYDGETHNGSYELGQLLVARKVVHGIVQQLTQHMPQGPQPLREFDD
jgi:hypothetical protein